MDADSLVRRIFRADFFWPKMRQQAKEFVQKCDACQRHANIPTQHAEYLTSLSCTIPFSQWGIDILGSFTPAKRQKKFILVVIDYFTNG